MKLQPALLVAAALTAALALAPTAAPAATASPFGNLAYRAIGPAISGGRTTAAVGSNRDPLLYYVGGADGGVFKSIDGGLSWRPVFDRAATAAIGAIALAPGNPNIVWVGTGESNPRNDAAMGDGIWRSTNGGKTWQHLGLDGAGAISSITIDPRNPNVVAVGVLGQEFRSSTQRGVYVTRDGGAHWTRTLYVGPSSGASDLIRLPHRPSTLLAGIYQFRRTPWGMTSGGPQGGLYRSDDNGATWRKLSEHGLPSGLTGRIGLAASGNRIYAIIESKQGQIWRSDDGGTTWKAMPHSSYVGGRPFYFSKLIADPANANRVIDVGLVLSRSLDGGKTFHAIAKNGGWDYHMGWWSADGKRVIVGADEGVLMSSTGGNTWSQPYDLPFAQPYHIGLGTAAHGYLICFGLQDNSSWCGPSSTDNGIGILNRDWFVVGGGDGMWAGPDPTDPNLIWSTSTNNDTGEVYLYNRTTKQAPEVSPYAHINGGEAADALKYRFNWITPLAFTTGTHPKALVGGNVVFESADRGQTWKRISPDLTHPVRAHEGPAGGAIHEDMSGAETYDTILDVETTPLDPQVIWVGTDDGLVQLTRDGGTHWTNVTPPGTPKYGRVQTVEPGHAAAGTAYAAVDDHMLGNDRPYIFATDDFGKTWRSIAGNLPKNAYVRVVREDPTNPNLLFAGTAVGIFVTFDRGAHWRSLRLNMPASVIYDLQIQPKADDLVAAAHGRGIWILDDLRGIEGIAKSTPTVPTLFAPRTAYAAWTWAPVNSFSDGMPDNVFVGTNPPYGALITYDLSAPAKTAPTIDILDAQGTLVRHLAGKSIPNRVGLNRTSWDLAANGPVKWTGTFKLNQGPDEGATVPPGSYTVRLNVDGKTYTQPLLVKADPRDDTSQAQLEARYAFQTTYLNELSAVDRWLNSIDARLKRGGPRAVALRAFARQLTYGPQTDEDLGGPPGLRERINDVLARTSSSFQPPNQPIAQAAAAVTREFARLAAEAAKLGIK